MEYDIIGKLAGLADSGIKPGVKLAMAAGFFLKAFAFDQSCLYIREGEGGGFTLRGSKGSGPKIKAYGINDGALRLVRGKAQPVEVYKAKGSDAVWNEDKGLKGFKYAVICPIRKGRELDGALYLKALERKRLDAKGRLRLKNAALQLTLLLRFAVAIKELEAAKEELKEARSALKDSEKLITLGDMAAALAHEIRNPLLSIGGFTARLKKHLGAEAPVGQYLERISLEVARLEKIMDGAFRFFKESSLELKPDDMNEIAGSALSPFEDELGVRGIELKKEFYGRRLPVLADREQIKIAFDNLIANAIQSMEKGGVLTMATALSGNSVLAKVADTGGGIDAKIMDKIFKPFFTTKGNGTGLGLTIAKTIVARHRGSVQVENRAGAGAVFTISLPYAGEKEGPAPPA
ncbi:MAG: ATP-binding protein [Deltaproteobacteria bacterium]|nr:ATP-binding protein [Deltaproteobacteria bacterium]